MLGLSPWLSLIAVLAATMLARLVVRAPTTALASIADRVASLASGRWAPPVAGLLTGAVTWYVWGSLTRSPVVHDETAYLLQAGLFARFRWTAPALGLPAFFEQLYVNLAPALSSKYPPGTSLLLAPGVLLGLPGLPIVVMNALSGALLYAIGRRLAGGLVAALAWSFWITSFPVLYFHAMYLSEIPSSLAWLAAWWGLERWRTGGRTRDLAVAAAAVALCAVTRPLTAVALAIAVGVAMLVVLARRHELSPPRVARVSAPFAAAALAVVAVLALWSWRSTGDPRLSPLTLYTRTYVPFDGLGFGVRDGAVPAARLPWDQRITSLAFHQEHLRHTARAIPAIAAARARMIAHDMWYDWRGGLAVVAIAGLVGAGAGVWFGLGALAVQLAAYLLYAHPWTWSLYYIETLPALALLTALGVARLQGRAGDAARERRLAFVAAILLVATLYPAARTVSLVRAQIASDHRYYDAFARMLPRTPRGAIVFVRYAPTHNDGLSLVRNVPVSAEAPVWTVYDRGAENARLAATAPERSTWLFDEATWSMRALPLAPAEGAERHWRARGPDSTLTAYPATGTNRPP